jgi:hypothetical protein
MASQPLRRALVEALERRALSELGAAKTSLEYVESWVRAGGTIQSLSKHMAGDLGHPVSRNFVSFVCNRLTTDAKGRIQQARVRSPPRSASGAFSQPATAVADPRQTSTSVLGNHPALR